jgi:hypothetical protein
LGRGKVRWRVVSSPFGEESVGWEDEMFRMEGGRAIFYATKRNTTNDHHERARSISVPTMHQEKRKRHEESRSIREGKAHNRFLISLTHLLRKHPNDAPDREALGLELALARRQSLLSLLVFPLVPAEGREEPAGFLLGGGG